MQLLFILSLVREGFEDFLAIDGQQMVQILFMYKGTMGAGRLAFVAVLGESVRVYRARVENCFISLKSLLYSSN